VSIKNKYHIFNPENAKRKGYYPRELLQMIEELPNFEKEFNIEVGEIYTVRAFFAISKPINNEVGYQSGFLDVKLIMNESENFIGEVIRRAEINSPTDKIDTADYHRFII